MVEANTRYFVGRKGKEGKELAALSPGTTVMEDISALESTDQSLGRGKKKRCLRHKPPPTSPQRVLKPHFRKEKHDED